MVGRVFWAFSASSLLSLWVALELRILGFVGFILASIPHNPKIAILYFLAQAVGSGGVLLAAILCCGANKQGLSLVIMVVFLLLKIGVFPFHNWLLVLLIESSWDVFIVASTIQKFIPFMVIFIFSNWLLYACGLLNILVCVYSLNTTLHLKLTLAYASVARTSWALVRSSIFLAIGYIMTYGLGLLGLWRLYFRHSNESISSSTITRNSGYIMAASFILFLSLRGVPPTVGFWVKLSILVQISASLLTLGGITITLLSVVILFAYTRIILLQLTTRAATEYGSMNVYRGEGVFYAAVVLCGPVLAILL